MDLIVQPDDGLDPVVKTINGARTSLDIIIFRFDLKPVVKAIEAAVGRGVVVRALIAHMNSSGEKRLRQIEQRMLEAGVTVSRTAGDLVRYHGKMMIGKVAKRGAAIRVAKFAGKRLHVRGIVRDGDTAFVGSQSLRTLELDGRREVG